MQVARDSAGLDRSAVQGGSSREVSGIHCQLEVCSLLRLVLQEPVIVKLHMVTEQEVMESTFRIVRATLGEADLLASVRWTAWTPGMIKALDAAGKSDMTAASAPFEISVGIEYGE
jgi:hypothetical protein